MRRMEGTWWLDFSGSLRATSRWKKSFPEKLARGLQYTEKDLLQISLLASCLEVKSCILNLPSYPSLCEMYHNSYQEKRNGSCWRTDLLKMQESTLHDILMFYFFLDAMICFLFCTNHTYFCVYSH